MNAAFAIRSVLISALTALSAGCVMEPLPGGGMAHGYPPPPMEREQPPARPPRPVHRPVPLPPVGSQDYVVRLAGGMSPQAFARRHGLTFRRAMLSDPFTCVFSGRAGVLDRLRSDSAVIWAEPDQIVRHMPMR
jgi:hypothetical protein